MKKIINNNSFIRWNKIIDGFIPELMEDEYKNKQKIIELCHVAKLLDNLDTEAYIEEMSESPDFLINYQNRSIGVELKRLTEDSQREYEGFFETIFLNAEKELKKETPISNILANCWLYSNINYNTHQKKEYIQLVIKVIKEFVKKGVLIKNTLIEDIRIMPHSDIVLCPNFGGWLQKYLSNDILQTFIRDKETRLLSQYRQNSKEIWLLVIIGGMNTSSYQIDESISYYLETKFDRVYLLEDFYNNLYQIK